MPSKASEFIRKRKQRKETNEKFYVESVKEFEEAGLTPSEILVALKEVMTEAEESEFEGDIGPFLARYREEAADAIEAERKAVAKKKKKESERSQATPAPSAKPSKKATPVPKITAVDEGSDEEDDFDGEGEEFEESESDILDDIDEPDDESKPNAAKSNPKKKPTKRERAKGHLDYDDRLVNMGVSETMWDTYEDNVKEAFLENVKRKDKSSCMEHFYYDISTLQSNRQNALIESNWKSATHAQKFIDKNIDKWSDKRDGAGIKEDLVNQATDLRNLIELCKSDCFGEDAKKKFNTNDPKACRAFIILAKATMAFLIRLEFKNFTRAGAAAEIERRFGEITLTSKERYEPEKMRAEYMKIKEKIKKAQPSGGVSHVTWGSNSSNHRRRGKRHHSNSHGSNTKNSTKNA